MPLPYPPVCANGAIDGSCPYTPSYENRECTSGAAWWGRGVLRKVWPTGWGSALNWPGHARGLGWRVDFKPAINSIMALAPFVNGAGRAGHVAFVVSVDAVHGEVIVWQYNGEARPLDHRFSVGTYPISGAAFIHIPAAAVSPPPHPSLKGEPVFIAQGPAGQGDYLVFDNAATMPIGAASTVTELEARIANLPVVPVDLEFIKNCELKSVQAP